MRVIAWLSSQATAEAPDVHPNVAEVYRTKVVRLAETLAEPNSNGKAREDTRSLVGEVVITPGEQHGSTQSPATSVVESCLRYRV